MIDIRLLNRQPRGHFVSAVFVDLRRALRQRLDEIEAFDAAAASFPNSGFVEADDDCWPMEFVRDARGDNSQNSRMPVAFVDDNRGVAGGIELFRDLLLGRGRDFSLHFLPITI